MGSSCLVFSKVLGKIPPDILWTQGQCAGEMAQWGKNS